MGVLEDLLCRGYFPVHLPPGFSSASFASELPQFQATWDALSPQPNTLGERFSVARSSFYRRNTAVINPIGFYFIAQEVAKYWPQIEQHYRKSTLSRSTPAFGQSSLRAIKLRKFSELYQVMCSAGYKFALVTDITTFFSSVYTHTIPWALHGKAIAKRKRSSSKRSASVFGNNLDERCMAAQDGQTIGLPIGPDTSHILAEILAVAIDEALAKNLGCARWIPLCRRLLFLLRQA